MNILASTPQKYGSTKYIVEITSEEVNALLTLGSYSEIELIDKDGNRVKRKRDEMVSGDVIGSSMIEKTAEEIRGLRSAKSEMDSAIATMRGAMTKIQNIIKPN